MAPRFDDSPSADAPLEVTGTGPAPEAGAFDAFGLAFGLSDREGAVLIAAIRGCSMKEAAARLCLSTKTVETYWRRIYNKTGRRTQLEVLAELLRWSMGERRYFQTPRSADQE